MKRAAIAVGVLLAIAVGLALAEFVATWIYFLVLKTMPDHVSSGDFVNLWDQLSGVAAHRKKLMGAGVAALVLVFVAPGLIIAHLTSKKRSLHGDARFARGSEVRKAGLLADNGLIVGKYQGKFLMFPGQQFVLLAAPTRSGKGVGVVIPNLLNWPDSVVVLDIKGENFEKTSGFRAKHGQAVFMFNPFSTEFRSHRWNPLASVSRDPNFRVGDIQAIAEVFYPTDHNQKETFWNDQAQNLFLGLALYLMDVGGLPCTCGEILRQGSGYGQPLPAHLKAVIAEHGPQGTGKLSALCMDALGRFLSNSENTFASIKSTFEAPLLMFANPIVDAATSGNDFDLGQVRRKRMSVYVVIQPNRLAVASRLLNLFFSELVNQNTMVLPENDATLKYQCLLLPDEFTSMGRIGIIAKSIAFLAGYGLRLLPIIQSHEQVEDVYGKESARNFFKNHDLKIIFPPDDIEDAERVSKMLGYFTEKAESTGRSRPTMFGKGGNVTESENVSDQRRALMMPQEIREMPQDEAIIIKGNTKPILCKKIKYYEEPIFIARLLPPIVVAPMDMAMHQAMVNRKTQVVSLNEIKGIDMNTLAIDTSAITAFVGDPDNPTREEANAVVRSFFGQLGWGDADEESLDETERAPISTLPAMAGRIDLAVLEQGGLS